jgi:hypothetical protein
MTTSLFLPATLAVCTLNAGDVGGKQFNILPVAGLD